MRSVALQVHVQLNGATPSPRLPPPPVKITISTFKKKTHLYFFIYSCYFIFLLYKIDTNSYFPSTRRSSSLYQSLRRTWPAKLDVWWTKLSDTKPRGSLCLELGFWSVDWASKSHIRPSVPITIISAPTGNLWLPKSFAVPKVKVLFWLFSRPVVSHWRV